MSLQECSNEVCGYGGAGFLYFIFSLLPLILLIRTATTHTLENTKHFVDSFNNSDKQEVMSLMHLKYTIIIFRWILKQCDISFFMLIWNWSLLSEVTQLLLLSLPLYLRFPHLSLILSLFYAFFSVLTNSWTNYWTYSDCYPLYRIMCTGE